MIKKLTHEHMQHLVLLVIVYLFTTVVLIAQTKTDKFVFDRTTNEPIPFANVYIKNRLVTGTISNTDGRFVLKNITGKDTLVISHLSYESFSDRVNNILSDTIYLIPKITKLKEVRVSALSAYSIMEKVIEKLPENHFTDNTIYKTFTRVIECEKDYSEIHILGEYLINLYERKHGRFNYQVVKIRVKPFSLAGKKAFKDYRMILAIATYDWAYIFDQEDVFIKRKLKLFQITHKGEFSDEHGVYIKLLCQAKESNKQAKNIILYIDKASFGIKKCIINYSETEYNEVGYKQIGSKWYLAYFKRHVRTDFYKKTKIKKDSEGILIWEAVYNLASKATYNKDLFKSFVNIVAAPIKYYNGNWNDDFWKNYNYIPLSDWVKEKIEEAEQK